MAQWEDSPRKCRQCPEPFGEGRQNFHLNGTCGICVDCLCLLYPANPWAGQRACGECGSDALTLPSGYDGLWRCTACSCWLAA